MVRKWNTPHNSQGKQTERGNRGIFIGFDSVHKGYLVYCPGSCHILTSEDVIFDESFVTAIALSWQHHRDSLALQPVLSTIPLITDTLEHTGGPADFLPVEEGKPNTDNANTDNVREQVDEDEADAEEDDHTNDTASVSEDSIIPWDMIHPQQPSASSESDLFVMDDSQNLQCSTRIRKPNSRYMNMAKAVAWVNVCKDKELLETCAMEAHSIMIPATSDAHSWEPTPEQSGIL